MGQRRSDDACQDHSRGTTELDGATISGTQWLGTGSCYRYLSATDSTNSEALRLAEQGAPHGTLVVADEQSAGRGRLGRRWLAQAGENLTFSVLLRPSWTPATVPPVSLAVGVGLAEGLCSLLGAPPTVKWPNDLLCAGRKICGVLVELSAQADAVRHVVVGVGLNVNQIDFPAPVAAIATSLRRELGRCCSRVEVLSVVLSALERRLDQLLAGEVGPVLQAWRKLATWLGSSVEVAASGGERWRGIARGLDDDGALLLDVGAGDVRRILSGDMTL